MSGCAASEIVSYHKINFVADYPGMWFLIKTGILLFLITLVVGSHEELSKNNCNCERRYYKHYEAKGCIVEQVDSCGCPKRFLCNQSSDISGQRRTCIYQNQEYKIGSRINITDKCQFCRCLGGEKPQITCRQKECPQLESVGDENCHLVYEKDQCCPLKYDCVPSANENEANTYGSYCVYDEITYPLGAKIYLHEDPCLICECTDDWKGITNSSCYQQDCLYEKNMNLLEKGCVPVYHENKCCPIEFLCWENANLNDVFLEKEVTGENSEARHDCTFAGKSYSIGMDLLMKNPCITCSCLVPPDLTCIHMSCPQSTGLEHCESIYSSEYCCPSYECFYNDSTNANNSSKVVCPTPLCADATCQIKIPDGYLCPTCICEESVSHEKNMFEPNDEVMMEGSLQNASFSENFDDTKNDSEEFEAEVMIPIESEFTSQNVSERLSEKVHTEYDFIEDSEHEMEMNANISEKGSETLQNSQESLYEKPDYIDEESIHDSNLNFSEKEEGLIKILRKRSNDFRNSNGVLTQAQQNGVQLNQFSENQQHFLEEEADDEIRQEISEDSNESYDELKLLNRNRHSEENGERRLDEEELIGSESVIVPDGCPTPLCANSSCKIEIPVGHLCPTCVCKRRENRLQP